MSIETLIAATALPSQTVGVDSIVQTSSTTTEAFTTTLQAQVQRLNIPPMALPAAITPIPVDLGATMPMIETKIPLPTATIDSTHVTLQATATADLTTAFPTLLSGALSAPMGSQAEQLVASPVKAAMMQATEQPILENPVTAVITQTTEQLVMTSPVKTGVNPATIKNNAESQPVGMPLPNVTADMNTNPLSMLLPADVSTGVTAQTQATLTPAIPEQKVIAPQKSQLTTTSAVKKEIPADDIQAQLAALFNSNATGVDTQPADITQVMPTKKADKMRVIAEIAQPIEQMQVTVTAVHQPLPPLEAALTNVPDTATQETVVNSLLQAGVLQPTMVETSKSTTSKNEALTLSLPKSISMATFLPNTTPASVTAEASSANNTLSDLLATSDINAPKMTFTAMLDNLKPNDSSAALDAGLAKTLSNLSSELAAFERPANLPVKAADISPMTAHLYSPDFNEELGTKIIWMTTQNLSSAELTLNPKHLGPISIHITMQQEQTSVAFTAQNAGVKEMLEASIPKLREMLQSQNLNLADVNVSQQSFSGQNQGQAQSPYFGQQSNGKRAGTGLDGIADANLPANEAADHIEQSRTLVSNGLVSLYA